MKIGHEMILASAGSGKTYALTNRFVRLLALGAQPDRIVALTFTRKAAGEFFDEILKKLARAASDPVVAEKLAHEIGVDDAGPTEFLTMLRAVVETMHRLRLGTFDGFFAHIAKNFPLELGLAGEFEVLEEHAAQMEHHRVLHRMFARSGPVSEAQKEFIEAFKQATFGSEDKRPGARLGRFIEQHQETFLEAPDGDLWGNAARIWPEGTAWFAAVKQRKSAVKTLRTEIAISDLNDRQRARWDLFFAELGEWSPGVPMGKGLAYLFGNALKAWPELETLMVERKKQLLSAVAAEALRMVIQSIIGAELARRLAMTRGIHAVIGGYEAIYHETVRRAGKLAFADVQRLLMPMGPGARQLSVEGADDCRMLIDFRLDAEIDHWLLDEFQDTSFGQWSVLKNLIDEAVQDPSEARSFFYVGDVKQSIYAWRDGDPRLFREIFDHYNEIAPGTIRERHLDVSWRSGPPVIAMVNDVFSDAATLETLFPGAAATAWNREWRDHQSALPQRGGHAALLYAEDESARFAVTLQLLDELSPLERGLSVAVLVQKNDTAAALADYLRREGGVPAIAEADLHVGIDNPVGAALLALVKAAAHPGDTLAWEHVRMTPLGVVLTEAGIGNREKLTGHVLGRIYAEGFEATLHGWWRKLEKTLAPEDAFSRLRARQFLAAAGQFDLTGSRSVAEFVDFITRYTVREADSAAVVRVMTIHKAKGLGFDLVILPDLEGQKLAQAREGLVVQRTEDHEIEWVLDAPAKDMAEQDPVLAAHLAAAEAAACYEKLSLLYVAMTRAKRALYLVIKPPGRSSSRNFTRLLEQTLGDDEKTVSVGRLQLPGAYAQGDGNWHDKLPSPTLAVPEATFPMCLNPQEVKKSRRLPALRPSDGQTGTVPAEALFALGPGTADFGKQVHRLLAGVEWVAAGDIDYWTEMWADQGEAGQQALGCLRASDLAGIWSRGEGAGLWRERTFEAVIDGVWVTGVFDRVIVERNAAGVPVRAQVYDFKTDEDADEAAKRHRRQLDLYRQAVAQLLGISPQAVECWLVLTRLRLGIVVPPSG